MSANLHRAAPTSEDEPSLANVGPQPPALSDAGLLAILLAGPDRSESDLALSLIERFGTVGGIMGADAAELSRAGVGRDQVRFLKYLGEAARRLAREDVCRRPVISSWSGLIGYVRTALANLPREEFRALYLDKRNVLLRDEWVASGTVDHAPVYPREVVRRALELSASAMILVHNHPSGDPTPSTADIDMTRKVIDAARVFDIQVHDHLVVGREGTASFKSLGLM